MKIRLPVLAILLLTTGAQAEDCALCQINRERNAANPNPYTYYEDYLKAEGGNKGQTAPATPEAIPDASKGTTGTAPAPQAANQNHNAKRGEIADNGNVKNATPKSPRTPPGKNGKTPLNQ